jgi:hypothetical protein
LAENRENRGEGGLIASLDAGIAAEHQCLAFFLPDFGTGNCRRPFSESHVFGRGIRDSDNRALRPLPHYREAGRPPAPAIGRWRIVQVDPDTRARGEVKLGKVHKMEYASGDRARYLQSFIGC